jgi:hypothetical protein
MKELVKTTLPALAILVWLPAVRAQSPQLLFDGCHWSYPRLCALWQARKCWCADDYCPKTLPCVPPNARGCIDDYCRKTLPCVAPNPKGCIDDYCRKTCPILLGTNCEPWYTCGPAQTGAKSGCGKHTE